VARKHYNNPESIISGSKVEVRNNDFSKAFRRFKKKIQEDGILQELRNREYFEKPSIKNKKARAAARSRWLKQISRQQDI
jgi:small subunit ribosomal protein S21